MVVDYGTGNIQSVCNALSHLGHDVTRSNYASQFDSCDCLIFPGQGSFGPAMKRLKQLNLIEPLREYIRSKKPFIGICLGFQLLFDGSDESKQVIGLQTFDGQFNQFDDTELTVPHMGWNQINVHGGESILTPFNGEQFYFVHSYYLPNTSEQHFASTNYGQPFISAVANDTQLLTQFHPEKSGDVGLQLLDIYLKTL
jgi:glutamine amidotransferase/cyclase